MEFYPSSPGDALRAKYVGKTLHNVPTPAAVIDVAAVRRNCARMLQTCESLQLKWRAHVKTHKTVELTRLQVGDDPSRPVNLIVSTLIEAEFLLPALKDYVAAGRKVNVLYGLPIPHGALERLAAIAKALGKDSVSILLDDPAQIPVAAKLKSLSGVVPLAHIKVDMGGRRAGVEVESERFAQLADAALAAHGRGDIVLLGLYSHAGHSYGGDSRAAAMKMMRAELDAMVAGADKLLAKDANLPPLTVSAGASPTTLSVQNLLASNDSSVPAEVRAEVDALTQLLASIRNKGHDVEIHAGVYPTLDLQQLAAHSMAASRLSWGDIALTILAEVHSQYPGRGANGTDEALIGAGGLALARETCKAYEGMAMMTPWGRGTKLPECDVEDFSGWVVGRFSQEHGILTWRGDGPADKTPQVGERVKLWPNHACITSSHFGWYFVTDSDGQEDVITDVWVKARGW